jgi:hypothetical protein
MAPVNKPSLLPSPPLKVGGLDGLAIGAFVASSAGGGVLVIWTLEVLSTSAKVASPEPPKSTRYPSLLSCSAKGAEAKMKAVTLGLTDSSVKI